MAEIITIGEILVEIMTKSVGQTFEEIGEYTGPYASGAPAIFIDQTAKTGSSSAIVAKVGNDGFGKLNVERLKRDGVDVQFVGIEQERTTGIAFVTYKENGDRDFIFTTKGSAAAELTPMDIKEEMFKDSKYFHIMGCSFFNDEMIEVFRRAISLAKAQNVLISFDPNIRKEIMEDEKLKALILFALESCDIFLPGENELKWITGIEDEEEAVRSVLSQHASCVIVKKGSRGGRVYEREHHFDIEPYQVEEVDPTGAGDCFAGTFISLLNQGKSIEEAVKYANASGAYAVMKNGPMEGTATLEELKQFMKLNEISAGA
ncbi:sugar kinase [Paenibacillus eucommiae]|uniref:Sugar/nucleoside kinase (Ribokinase family) n=1 Tax=Paenibacillus eucommiae TaxID=1355755 RepID=A0ABS4JA13_9BACL|nr:sugar kinase [Paenibacillus eucommiae]MBP1996091.1 sugar/nucleoside kinase (ribokinase family) [Paenibacillus eucommiae]